MTNSAEPFTMHDPAFDAVIGTGFRRLLLTETNAHEGPVYVAAEHALYFTTVPEPGPKNIAIRRLRLTGDAFPFGVAGIETVRQPSNMANGMALDGNGGLVICEQGTRQAPARIARMDLQSGTVETVIAGFNGLPFNSPNDVVVKRDGTIWFTDPDYGQLQGFKGPAQLAANVYRHDPTTGETSLAATGFDKPNGLAFAPDEAVLYITDTGADQASGAYFPARPHHVTVWDVADGRHVSGGRVFATVTPGTPDGIKLDQQGRVYTSSTTGVQVFLPDGAHIGEIAAPGTCNFTFGGPEKDVLFILADRCIWQARLAVRGA